jgi:phosphatidate cytidylyltransferase
MMSKAATAVTSDFAVRTVFAIALVAVAGVALWSGGWIWILLISAVAVGLLWEWWQLASEITVSSVTRSMWMIGGLVYIGLAWSILFIVSLVSSDVIKLNTVLPWIATVIVADVGAYFADYTIKGTKISQRISMNKTWIGLLAGMLSASLFQISSAIYLSARFDNGYWFPNQSPDLVTYVYLSFLGSAVAIVALSGHLLISWMKRQAGVNVSGRLMMGAGGLFDRLDGIVALMFAFFILGVGKWFVGL